MVSVGLRIVVSDIPARGDHAMLITESPPDIVPGNLIVVPAHKLVESGSVIVLQGAEQA